MRQLKTINLQGKKYAPVAERLRAFREDYPQGTITTQFEMLESGGVIFNTIVATGKGGTATAHSYGKNAGAKAFEKLETISLGRALGYAGYIADGEIATPEEMSEVVEKTAAEVISQLKEMKAKQHGNDTQPTTTK